MEKLSTLSIVSTLVNGKSGFEPDHMAPETTPFITVPYCLSDNWIFPNKYQYLPKLIGQRKIMMALSIMMLKVNPILAL